ncbi:MAG TPA: ectonucleotide pyrophosphatase/phosphodiesterase [Sphingomonas sp.]
MTKGPLMIDRVFRSWPLALAAACAGCAYPYTPPALTSVTQPAGPASGALATQEVRQPITLLIGIDGFRPDYLERGVTPVLSQLAAQGVTGSMRPSFPSKTFPNFWTLVTGLVPDRHGIVANSMEDPARPGETFTMATDDPFWWNAAEPIWVTAEKAGVRTGTMFWPGANVGWGGVRAPKWPYTQTGGTRPSDWQQYAEAQTGEQRVRTAIDWLRRPAATRPRFVTLYFEAVDTAGHVYGPDAPQTLAAVAEVDRTLGLLASELAALGQPANVVIVADHGMTATLSTRTIALDTLVPATDARVVEAGPYATLAPLPGREAALEAALLRPHPHMTCWRKRDLPARFRYGSNPRVQPYLCLAENGWMIARTAPREAKTGGEHGYDPAMPDMRALFIANGPAFARGKRIGAFDNVDVAPLLRTLLRLPPGVGLDGSDRTFRGVMAQGARR